MAEKKKHKTIRYILFVLLFLIICLIGLSVYYYSQGNVGNYVPPKVNNNTNLDQVVSDLSAISQAVESYYAINLSYPSKLKDLVPEFIPIIPIEPQSNNEYQYNVYADSAYQISARNPQNYNLKELFIRNGKIVKN
jgi:hypothetical protein